MTKKYYKDYIVRVGRVNWTQYEDEEPEPPIDYIMEIHNGKYYIYGQTEEDANYLKIKHPEWFIHD